MRTSWYPTGHSSVRRELRSFACAGRGIRLAWRDHRHFRVHTVLGGVAVGAGWALDLPRPDWAVLLAMIALVMALEVVNTAIEAAVDLASPGRHPLAAAAKDAAAGAVLLAAVGAVAVAAVLFLPHLGRL